MSGNAVAARAAGLRRIAQLLAVPLFLALVGITVLQDKLLYFPDRLPLPDLLAGAKHDGLHPWPGDVQFRGLLREPAGTAHATLLLFHGNAGHAGHRAAYGELAALGVRVILAEYPGYGSRPGEPGEAALVADAVASIRLARQQFAGPLLVAGESLGAGVAAAAAAQVAPMVDGLLLLTPWDTLAAVAGYHYPWLPVRLLLRDRYDSAAHLATIAMPVAVVVAEQDEIVPARFGIRLYEQMATRKRLWHIAGAAHNDWMDSVNPNWWRDVLAFLLPATVDGPAGIR